MTSLSSGQITTAIVLVVGLATACQLLAPKLRIPALILLLPTGFILGLVAPQLRFDVVLGSGFPVLVDLVVAVILFQGGLDLSTSRLYESDRRIVRRLVWVGGAMTFACAAAAVHVIVGMEWPIAFMIGAILIVSGPTVVTPILNFAGLRGRVRGILQWEGTLLDPIGALVAVVVFQVVKASGAESLGDAVASFLASMLVGVIAACLGVVLFVVGGKLVRGNALMGTQVLLGSVIVIAGSANVVSEDTGLLAALLMGMSAPRIAKRFGASLENSASFFGTIVSMGIGILFVSIAALVPVSAVLAVLWPTLIVAALLIIVVRPLVVIVGTARTSLTKQERTFMACMDPRGIVAAATASSVSAALIAANIRGAAGLLPVVFLVVSATVAVYGLCAVPIARLMRLSSD